MARTRGKNPTELLDLALGEPTLAITAADELLHGELSELDSIVALRARGLAQRALGELHRSETDLSEAMQRAERLDANELWTGAAISLAGTRVFQGHVEEAKQLLTRCIDRSTGELHAEAVYQLGTTCAQAGEFDNAVAHYEEALPLIQRAGRQDWEAHLYGNRGAIHIYRGSYDEAIADLNRAIAMITEDAPSAYSLHRGNKAYALHLRGDIAEAIDLYEDNERFQDEHRLPRLMYSQRCTAYIAAGMYEEAMSLAQEAHRFHTEGDAVLGALEALLPGAEAALALGNIDLTRQLSNAAIALDREDSFPTFTARARLTLVESRLRENTSTRADIDRAVGVFDAVKNSNSLAASRSLLVGAAVALEHDEQSRARQLIDRAAIIEDQAPPHVRIERLRLSTELHGTSDQVILAAVDEALDALAKQLGGVTSYDVRYKAARHAGRLATAGINVALRQGRFRRAIAMVEELRSASLRIGRTQDRLDGAEDSIVRTDETYLVFIEDEDQVVCLVASTDAVVQHQCGSRAAIEHAVQQHRFAHGQLAHRASLTNAMRTELMNAAQLADDTLADLLVPLDLEDRVVINPSEILGPVLWGALRPLASRRFTMSPSMATTRRRLPATIATAAIAGALELAHVPDEVKAVAAIWNTTAMLNPDPNILEDLTNVDLLHVAGHFVADGLNPLFSALPLGNFHLRGHDYLQLSPPPAIAVLSACASGQGETVAGALVGFSSAVLAAGTATVVVSQAVLEDGPAIVTAMSRFHTALRSGDSPAEALHHVRSITDHEDRSVAASLATLGAGW